jgi:SAM-dependent methyltransferase
MDEIETYVAERAATTAHDRERAANTVLRRIDKVSPWSGERPRLIFGSRSASPSAGHFAGWSKRSRVLRCCTARQRTRGPGSTTDLEQRTLRAVGGELVLPPPRQRVVEIFEAIGRATGHSIGVDVLDFGAGAGRHVAEFRAAGYNALGVDQQHASHTAGSAPAEYLRRVEPPHFTLPFPSGSFDFVFSTSVMEHVLDPGIALTQIARVLRPGGWSAHVFPSRWRPIEPHMYTPFGGRFNNFALLRLWALAGVRNGFQRGLPATEVALRNAQYAKTGIHYTTETEWRLRAQPLFAEVQWAERAYVEATADGISRVSRLIRPIIGMPGMARAYRALHTRVLVLAL